MTVKTITKNALVPYTASQMYHLVNDIDSYAEFLPWCDESKVLEKTDSKITASINIAYGSVNKSFTTLNTLTPGERMDMELIDGPFKTLQGEWLFTQLGDDGCKVSLNLDFEFKNKLLDITMGPIFSKIANTLVDSFTERATNVYS